MDTLEIAKKLEGAGFDRRQAEAVASVMAGGVGERDEQLDDLRTRLGKVEAAVEMLGHKIDGLGQKLDTRIEAIDHKGESRVAQAQFQVIAWTVGALAVFAAIVRLSLSQ